MLLLTYKFKFVILLISFQRLFFNMGTFYSKISPASGRRKDPPDKLSVYCKNNILCEIEQNHGSSQEDESVCPLNDSTHQLKIIEDAIRMLPNTCNHDFKYKKKNNKTKFITPYFEIKLNLKRKKNKKKQLTTTSWKESKCSSIQHDCLPIQETQINETYNPDNDTEHKTYFSGSSVTSCEKHSVETSALNEREETLFEEQSPIVITSSEDLQTAKLSAFESTGVIHNREAIKDKCTKATNNISDNRYDAIQDTEKRPSVETLISLSVIVEVSYGEDKLTGEPLQPHEVASILETNRLDYMADKEDVKNINLNRTSNNPHVPDSKEPTSDRRHITDMGVSTFEEHSVDQLEAVNEIIEGVVSDDCVITHSVTNVLVASDPIFSASVYGSLQVEDMVVISDPEVCKNENTLRKSPDACIESDDEITRSPWSVTSSVSGTSCYPNESVSDHCDDSIAMESDTGVTIENETNDMSFKSSSIGELTIQESSLNSFGTRLSKETHCSKQINTLHGPEKKSTNTISETRREAFSQALAHNFSNPEMTQYLICLLSHLIVDRENGIEKNMVYLIRSITEATLMLSEIVQREMYRVYLSGLEERFLIAISQKPEKTFPVIHLVSASLTLLKKITFQQNPYLRLEPAEASHRHLAHSVLDCVTFPEWLCSSVRRAEFASIRCILLSGINYSDRKTNVLMCCETPLRSLNVTEMFKLVGVHHTAYLLLTPTVSSLITGALTVLVFTMLPSHIARINKYVDLQQKGALYGLVERESVVQQLWKLQLGLNRTVTLCLSCDDLDERKGLAQMLINYEFQFVNMHLVELYVTEQSKDTFSDMTNLRIPNLYIRQTQPLEMAYVILTCSKSCASETLKWVGFEIDGIKMHDNGISKLLIAVMSVCKLKHGVQKCVTTTTGLNNLVVPDLTRKTPLKYNHRESQDAFDIDGPEMGALLKMINIKSKSAPCQWNPEMLNKCLATYVPWVSSCGTSHIPGYDPKQTSCDNGVYGLLFCKAKKIHSGNVLIEKDSRPIKTCDGYMESGSSTDTKVDKSKDHLVTSSHDCNDKIHLEMNAKVTVLIFINQVHSETIFSDTDLVQLQTIRDTDQICVVTYRKYTDQGFVVTDRKDTDQICVVTDGQNEDQVCAVTDRKDTDQLCVVKDRKDTDQVFLVTKRSEARQDNDQVCLVMNSKGTDQDCCEADRNSNFKNSKTASCTYTDDNDIGTDTNENHSVAYYDGSYRFINSNVHCNKRNAHLEENNIDVQMICLVASRSDIDHNHLENIHDEGSIKQCHRPQNLEQDNVRELDCGLANLRVGHTVKLEECVHNCNEHDTIDDNKVCCHENNEVFSSSTPSASSLRNNPLRKKKTLLHRNKKARKRRKSCRLLQSPHCEYSVCSVNSSESSFDNSIDKHAKKWHETVKQKSDRGSRRWHKRVRNNSGRDVKKEHKIVQHNSDKSVKKLRLERHKTRSPKSYGTGKERSFKGAASRQTPDKLSQQRLIRQELQSDDSGIMTQTTTDTDSWLSWRTIVREYCERTQQHQISKDVARRLYVDHAYQLQGNVAVYGLRSFFNRVNTGEPLTQEEEMQFEWLRFITFSVYEGEGNGIALARNGFYHCPELGPTATRCFACDFVYEGWTLLENVEVIHRRLSPNCPLLHNNSGQGTRRNISIAADDGPQRAASSANVNVRDASATGTAQSAGATSITQPPQSVSIFPHGRSPANFNHPATPETLRQFDAAAAARRNASPASASHTAVSPLTERLGNAQINELEEGPRSILAQPTEDPENREARSHRAGYNDQDRSVSGIRPSDMFGGGPVGHGAFAASLPVTTRQPQEPLRSSSAPLTNLPLTTETVTRSSSSATIAGPSQTTTPPQQTAVVQPRETEPRRENVTLQRSSTPLKTVPAALERPSHPRGPEDPSLNVDLTTGIYIERPRHPEYNTLQARITTFTDWPAHLDQDTRQLAELGFFHVGVADFVRCFACGGGLRNWERGDNPLVEHIRWFPNCEYMRKLKGQAIIDLVLRHVREQEAAEGAAGSRTSDLNTTDPLQTSVAQQLIDMGFPENRVKDGIIGARQRHGREDVTANEVIEWMEANPTEAAETKTPVRMVVRQSERPVQAGPSTTTTTTTGSSSSTTLTTSQGQVNVEVTVSGNNIASTTTTATVTAGGANDDDDEYETPPEGNTSAQTKSGGKKKKKKKTKGGTATSESANEGAAGGQTEAHDPVAIQRENERLRDMQTCKICMERPVDTTLLPCGHLVTCNICAQRLAKCPICRKKKEGAVKTFMS